MPSTKMPTDVREARLAARHAKRLTAVFFPNRNEVDAVFRNLGTVINEGGFNRAESTFVVAVTRLAARCAARIGMNAEEFLRLCGAEYALEKRALDPFATRQADPIEEEH